MSGYPLRPQAGLPQTPDTWAGGAGMAGGRAALGDEPLEDVAASGPLVGTGGHAAARRGARHRADRLDRQGTGHVGQLAPGAVLLVDQERRVVTSVVELPAGRAVACRGARHRGNLRAPGAAPGAGDCLGGSPGPVHLADHERLIAGGIAVLAAGRAVAR